MLNAWKLKLDNTLGKVFGFAGLWEEWLDKQTGEMLKTRTIITTEANDVLKHVHDRMPVILKSESYDE